MRGSVGMHSDSPHGRPSMPDQEFRFSGTEVHGHIIVPIRRTCDDANGPAGYYLIPGPITTSIARKCHSGSWSEIGAAWDTKDRRGFILHLNAIPLDSRVLLVPSENS